MDIWPIDVLSTTGLPPLSVTLRLIYTVIRWVRERMTTALIELAISEANWLW